MIYLLVLVILGGGNAGNHSLRVGNYRSLGSCQAAADEAKGIGLDKGSFGFVCVRAFGPPDLASVGPGDEATSEASLARSSLGRACPTTANCRLGSENPIGGGGASRTTKAS